VKKPIKVENMLAIIGKLGIIKGNIRSVAMQKA